MKLPGLPFGLSSIGRRRQPDTADAPAHEPDEHFRGPSVQMLTIRVAMAAAAVVAVAYIVIAAVVAIAVSSNLVSDVDRHLTQALQTFDQPGRPLGQGAGQGAGQGGPFDPGRLDPRGVPVLVWKVSSDGTVVTQGLTNVTLPAEDRAIASPTTVSIDGASYRLAGVTVGSERYVAAQALDGVNQTESTLLVAEIGIGCALLIFVFLGAWVVGRRVALPIERTRQRQLAFTADASHELRTPLSVIEAQTSLALARKREAAWDAKAFERIDGELKRTRRLVDDMLWLARFDSTAALPDAEPVDLAVLAAQTADRFTAVAEARGQKVEVAAGSGAGADASANAGAIVTAPAEWLDRLLGVLLDNACKFSPQGGRVRVSVAAEGRRVRLAVDDSGPGIPAEERDLVFDRFHRAASGPGGAGLGLAIADAIVRVTGGKWSIGSSPLGGASVTVSWPRAMAGTEQGAGTGG